MSNTGSCCEGLQPEIMKARACEAGGRQKSVRHIRGPWNPSLGVLKNKGGPVRLSPCSMPMGQDVNLPVDVWPNGFSWM